jgi:hypothetical protein
MLGPSTGFPRCFESCKDGLSPILCLLCSAGSHFTRGRSLGLQLRFVAMRSPKATDRRRVLMPSKNYLHLARYRILETQVDRADR